MVPSDSFIHRPTPTNDQQQHDNYRRLGNIYSRLRRIESILEVDIKLRQLDPKLFDHKAYQTKMARLPQSEIFPHTTVDREHIKTLLLIDVRL
jgi:hypothetical protein